MQSRKLLRLFLTLFAVSVTTTGVAQNKNKSGKPVKNPEKILKEADRLYRVRDITDAVKLYEEYLKANPNSLHAVYRTARCYTFMHNNDEALKWLTTAKEMLNDPANAKVREDSTLIFEYAMALKKAQRYEEAKSAFDEFLKYYKGDDFYRNQVKNEKTGCDDAIEVMRKNEQPEYRIVELPFNSASGDFAPASYVVKTDSFIIFTSHRAGSKGKRTFKENGEERFSDLWIVKKDSDSTFGAPENLGKKVNTKANDGGAVISPDGMTMYYTICGGGKYKKFWGCSIYMSRYNVEAKAWGKFEKVEELNGQRQERINTRGKTKMVPTYDAQPTLTASGDTMYFVSDREGGFGETDIWYSVRKKDSAWQKPINCGGLTAEDLKAGNKKGINTPGNEIYPYIAPDGKTLYFASDGHKGLGGYDIFMATGAGSSWSAPQNLGMPINSSYDDFALIYTNKSTGDSSVYFSSNRPGKGRDDIFGAKRIPRPKCEATVFGNVRDKETKQVIPFATVTLFKSDNGRLTPIDTFKTDQSGAYRFTISIGTDYKVVGNAPEYLANEERVTTSGIDCGKTTTSTADLKVTFTNGTYSYEIPKYIDILLERIEIDKPIVLQNIYYDYDKTDLRPESKAELERLAKLLTDNPSITIQLGSHTDTNGPEEYNIALSKGRALSVVDYLVNDLKIDPYRLSYFGYGESE
ncbi:MAG: OmpA family protein, partial [Bacteroidia bacterium]|nr:OmpA family protein [Bacteroidia bacterium]